MCLSSAHKNKWTVRSDCQQQCSLCLKVEGAIPYYYLPLTRGVTRKLERRGNAAIDCTYSRSQSAPMSGNETLVPRLCLPGNEAKYCYVAVEA